MMAQHEGHSLLISNLLMFQEVAESKECEVKAQYKEVVSPFLRYN